MNRYQIFSVFIIRLLGGLSFLVGVLGVSAISIHQIYPTSVQSGFQKLPSEIFYTLFGIVLYLVSKPIGRLLGRDLE
jgi:hypothetical protein